MLFESQQGVLQYVEECMQQVSLSVRTISLNALRGLIESSLRGIRLTGRMNSLRVLVTIWKDTRKPLPRVVSERKDE